VDIVTRILATPAISKPDLDIRHLPLSLDGPTKLLSIPARLKRTGMETKLLIQGPSGPASRKAYRSLLRLFGQAHRFRKILDTTSHDGSLAEITKVARSLVSAPFSANPRKLWH